MNKYSKRALKTTATVGMSLAMVLSGVAAPLVKVSAETQTVCTIANKTAAELLIDSIKADVKAEGFTLDNIPSDQVIVWTNTIAVSTQGTAVAVGDKFSEMLGKGSAIADTTIAQLVTIAAKEGCSDDYKKDAEKLAGFVDGVDGYETAMTALNTALAEGGDLEDRVISTSDWNADGATADESIKVLYDNVIEFEGYKNNVATTNKNKARDKDNIAEFKELVEDYTNTYISKFVKVYVETLEDEVVIKGKTVKELVKDAKDYSRDDLEALEDAIKDIKGDKLSVLTNTGVTYAQVGDEDEVVDYIEGLEAIVDEIKEVNDLLKTNTAPQKAYKAVKTKINALVTKIGTGKEDDITKAMNDFRTEDLENLTTYVEDFFNEFYTVTVKQRSNGNYSVDYEGTRYTRYLNKTDKEIFAEDESVGFLISNLVELDSEETYYEALVGNVNDAEKLMKAVAAVEDIRLGSTFTTAEANKIVAARKAFTELTADGNLYNLSAKELRTVKANEDLITALYTKLILSGTITESGWIEKGDGNWDYINTDGSKSTKWVAAGKDWYFVQNGTMLRSAWVAENASGARWYYVDNAGKMVSNTTIDGFVIDANGVWTK